LLSPGGVVLIALLAVGAALVARLFRPLVPAPEYRSVVVLNRVFPTLLVVLLLTQPLFPLLGLGSYFGPPWDTFVLMAMWAWAGWYWLRQPPMVEETRFAGSVLQEISPLAPAGTTG
jgi:hypothetical protein